MRGRSVFFLPALLFPALLLGAQQVPSTLSTVDDLVRAGIANNKDLAAVRERIAEAKGLTRQAGVRPAPVLGLDGATGKPLGTIGEEQYGAEYSQSIETFGKRGRRIRVAEFSVGIAEADFQQRSTQLAYEITAAYAEVSAERHKLKVLSDLIGLNQDTLRLTEARVKEGDVAPLEASLLKVEISRAEVSRRSAQGRLTSAELELRRLAGLDQTAPIPDSEIPAAAPTDLDTLKRQALENRSDLKTARLEEEQEAAGIELAKAEAKPDVTLSAGYTRQDNQFDGLFGYNSSGALSPLRDRDDILKFGVSIPLRTSRSGAGNVQAATARTSGARLRREYLERNIPLEVEAAYQRWRTAADSLQLLQSGVLDPSTNNLSVIREAYKLGQLRLLDVLNEQRRLVDTQLAYIDAQADAARTWAEVQRATGGIHP
ncbi:TolC family protein [Acidicapsa ligni]|uniref:TolC family protein n=1 Tax=Acidicapsa ligni TaxID=542300 RepID=UPI0021DFF2C0|nr:TolC family protein [Acidicapsa ligni]